MKSLHKTALNISLGLLVVSLGLFLFDVPLAAGSMLTAFFVLAAFGARGNEKLRGFSYSLVIFAAVSLAMSFPAPFVSWGDFQLNTLITPLLQVIMFGMGTQVGVKDFVGVVKDPRGVGIGLVCQFTIMPFIGAGLALTFNLEPEVAAGIVLIGAAPSGLASNVMAYIGKANLALSVSLTTVAALLAPVITPFYMQWLGGQLIEVNTRDMMLNIIEMTVIPIVAGALVHHFLRSKMGWLDRIMPLVSIAGIALILMIMTASGRDNLLQIGLLLILISLLHNVSGYVLGYWSCRLLGLDERSCRTISFEVGMQNAGLANGLATAMGKAATVGLVPTVFGSLMNITGATLANFWRDRPPRDEAPQEEAQAA
jgi:BASS family bile acid:Na+ symporter